MAVALVRRGELQAKEEEEQEEEKEEVELREEASQKWETIARRVLACDFEAVALVCNAASTTMRSKDGCAFACLTAL